MALQIIGAGMGRTGTLSLKLALEALGFGPCHHMNALFDDPAPVRHWEDAWAGRPTDWAAIFAGYRSAVDFPSYPHWRALMQLYPEARVILTVREADRWYQSTLESTYRAYRASRDAPREGGPRLPPSRRARQLARVLRGTARLWQVEFEGRFEDRAYAIARFEAHNAEVIEAVPPERLLVFSVKQGWGPLCDFLGVAAPADTPFPRVNSRTEFHAALDAGLVEP